MRLRHGVKKDSKGYLTITAGPQRGKRVHTLVAEAMLGRELEPDEDVHHKDKNKLNCDWRNMEVLGHKDHGAVSRKQAWYFRTNEIKAKVEWDEYFEGEPTGKGSPSMPEEEDTSFP